MKQQTNKGKDLGDSNANAPKHWGGYTYAVLAGASAASASVFGKLAVDEHLSHWTRDILSLFLLAGSPSFKDTSEWVNITQ